ncbi:MAG: amidase family protein, partial [Roseovarius indicus]
MEPCLTLSAAEQAAAIARGRLTAETLMEATLDRIGAVNGAVNAIVSLRASEELLAEARAADCATPAGPLHGLPIAIKDLANVRGLPTSIG